MAASKTIRNIGAGVVIGLAAGAVAMGGAAGAHADPGVVDTHPGTVDRDGTVGSFRAAIDGIIDADGTLGDFDADNLQADEVRNSPIYRPNGAAG